LSSFTRDFCVKTDVDEVHEAGGGEKTPSGTKQAANVPVGTRGGRNPTSISSIPSNIIQNDEESETPSDEGKVRKLKRQKKPAKTIKLDCIYRKHNPQLYSGDNDCFTLRNKGYVELSQLT
jgi:hypothetical protein